MMGQHQKGITEDQCSITLVSNQLNCTGLEHILKDCVVDVHCDSYIKTIIWPVSRYSTSPSDIAHNVKWLDFADVGEMINSVANNNIIAL